MDAETAALAAAARRYNRALRALHEYYETDKEFGTKEWTALELARHEAWREMSACVAVMGEPTTQPATEIQ